VAQPTLVEATAAVAAAASRVVASRVVARVSVGFTEKQQGRPRILMG